MQTVHVKLTIRLDYNSTGEESNHITVLDLKITDFCIPLSFYLSKIVKIYHIKSYYSRWPFVIGSYDKM